VWYSDTRVIGGRGPKVKGKKNLGKKGHDHHNLGLVECHPRNTGGGGRFAHYRIMWRGAGDQYIGLIEEG